MSGSKYFERIAVTVTAFMLVLTVLIMNGAAAGTQDVTPRTMGYENRLFDNSRVHTVDVVMNGGTI